MKRLPRGVDKLNMLLLRTDKRTRISEMDRYFCLFICLYIVFDGFNSALQVAFNVQGRVMTVIKLAIQAVLAGTFGLGVIKTFRKGSFGVVVFIEAGILIAYFYSHLVGASGHTYNTWLKNSITLLAPLLISAYMIGDRRSLYDMLLISSWPLLIISTANYIFSKVSYDMHFSYSLIIVLLIHLTEWIRRKKVIYLLLVAAEFFMILTHGARGSILCLIAYILLKVFFSGTSQRRKIVYVMLIAVSSTILFLLFEKYSSNISAFLASKGISGRTVSLLFSGEFLSHDSERSEIWRLTASLIGQKPLLGWGIAGASETINAAIQRGTTYPHQFFLDLLLSFGWGIGSVLSLLSIYFTGVMIKWDENDSLVNHIFVSIAMVSLMYSSTLFTYYPFYIMLGLCLSTLRSRRYVYRRRW